MCVLSTCLLRSTLFHSILHIYMKLFAAAPQNAKRSAQNRWGGCLGMQRDDPGPDPDPDRSVTTPTLALTLTAA